MSKRKTTKTQVENQEPEIVEQEIATTEEQQPIENIEQAEVVETEATTEEEVEVAAPAENPKEVKQALTDESKAKMAKIEADLRAENKFTNSALMRIAIEQGISVSQIAKYLNKPYRQVYGTIHRKEYLANRKERERATSRPQEQMADAYKVTEEGLVPIHVEEEK